MKKLKKIFFRGPFPPKHEDNLMEEEGNVIKARKDLWFANCAVPEILFTHEREFKNFFEGLNIKLTEPCKFLIFPLSGGVISKTKVPRLPNFFHSFFCLFKWI